MQRDGANALTLVGPDNPNNSFSDPAEPYFWTPASNSGFLTFWDDSEDFTNFRVTLQVPRAPQTGAGEAGTVAVGRHRRDRP